MTIATLSTELMLMVVIVCGCVGGANSDVFTNNIRGISKSEKDGKIDLGTLRSVIIGGAAGFLIWTLGYPKPNIIEMGIAFGSGLTGWVVLQTFRKKEGIEESGLELVRAIKEQAKEIDRLNQTIKALRVLSGLSEEDLALILNDREENQEKGRAESA